jgi:hypothetical protein
MVPKSVRVTRTAITRLLRATHCSASLGTDDGWVSIVRSRCNLGSLLGISLIVLGTSFMGKLLAIIFFVVVGSVGNFVVGLGASKVVSSLAGSRVGFEVVVVDLSTSIVDASTAVSGIKAGSSVDGVGSRVVGGDVDTPTAVSGIKAGSSVDGVGSRVVGGDVTSGLGVVSIAGSGVDV